jgi:hypothetical protein
MGSARDSVGDSNQMIPVGDGFGFGVRGMGFIEAGVITVPLHAAFGARLVSEASCHGPGR